MSGDNSPLSLFISSHLYPSTTLLNCLFCPSAISVFALRIDQQSYSRSRSSFSPHTSPRTVIVCTLVGLAQWQPSGCSIRWAMYILMVFVAHRGLTLSVFMNTRPCVWCAPRPSARWPRLLTSLLSGTRIGESLKAIYARAIFYLLAERASRLDDSCFASSTTTHSSRAATALLSPFSFHLIYTHQQHYSTACFVLLPFLSSLFASTSSLTLALAPPSLRTHHPGL